MICGSNQHSVWRQSGFETRCGDADKIHVDGQMGVGRQASRESGEGIFISSTCAYWGIGLVLKLEVLRLGFVIRNWEKTTKTKPHFFEHPHAQTLTRELIKIW